MYIKIFIVFFFKLVKMVLKFIWENKYVRIDSEFWKEKEWECISFN